MNSKWYLLGIALLLGAVVLSGCGQIEAQAPTDVPIDDTTNPADDPAGEVPAGVYTARDVALAIAGAPELDWTEENTTPGWPEEPVPGWMEYRFSAEGWEVTVGYAVVAPGQVVYQVAIVGADGTNWEGEIDAAGQLVDAAGDVDAEDPVDGSSDEEGASIIPNPAAARDAAMAYISQNYQVWSTEAPAPELNWIEENITAEGLVGATKLRYTAADWMVTLDFPLVAPDATVYQVAVVNTSLGFEWAGEVNAQGQVTEQYVAGAGGTGGGDQGELPAAVSGEPAIAWYGYVVSTPDGAQYDDYLVLMPEGIGEIGIEGADEAVRTQIAALRDHPEPGKYAHFWGTVTCDVIDYGGCQLLVTRLRVDGPGRFFDPDPVEGWEGTIVSGPEGPRSGGDDYFVLSGDFPVAYGIDSTDPGLAGAIEILRDSGTTVRVWGQLSAGVMDWNGTQIQLGHIETPDAPPPAYGYEGWEGYMSQRFGYGFLYPSDLTVLEDQDGNVNISGPLVDNERWPCLAVSTYDSEFYLPPAGTDVVEWIAGSGMPYDEIDTEVQIAGLRTVHLRTEASPMAYAYDEYYFIEHDRLFRISIVQCGQEDWEFYNRFLAGFQFPHAP
jgi:hypothetical protein